MDGLLQSRLLGKQGKFLQKCKHACAKQSERTASSFLAVIPAAEAIVPDCCCRRTRIARHMLYSEGAENRNRARLSSRASFISRVCARGSGDSEIERGLNFEI